MAAEPTPYWRSRSGRAVLHYGDALEVLRLLPAGSVDAVVTDPPYGQTNEDYDSPVAFSPDVWEECLRVCKDSAALLSFAGSPTYHRIASAVEATGWKVVQMWAWVYRDGLITSAYPQEGFDRLAPAMDPIVFATKGKVLLDLRREGQPWKVCHKRKPGDCPLSARSNTLHAATDGSGHYPRSVVSDSLPGWEYFMYRRTKPDRNRTSHPNQKPLALMDWLLGKLPAGGIVLDPFCGSGTTGEAALGLAKGFVGIDLNAEYLDLARERLERVTPANPALLPTPPAPAERRERGFFDHLETPP